MAGTPDPAKLTSLRSFALAGGFAPVRLRPRPIPCGVRRDLAEARPDSSLREGGSRATLEVVPLGGLGEFGMNMMALTWEDSTILIDAGVMFPDPDQLGVDLIIPDLA